MVRITRADVALLFTFRGSVNRWSDGGLCMAKKAAAKKAAAVRRSMSDEHEAALAEGREQGRAVRRYLEALDQYRPKRGRKRTRQSVERRLQEVESRLGDATPLDRVHLFHTM